MSEPSDVEARPRTAERIRAFVQERFPLARQLATGEDDSLLASGIVDSLGILELVTFITEAFGVTVSDEDLLPENFDSIGSLTRYVERKTGGA